MRVEGRFEVPAPREAVWRSITDPALMVGCIPGCETIDTIDARNYRATVRVEIGPIKARFNLTVEITNEVPLEQLASVTRGEEGTRASIVSSENMLRLETLAPDLTAISYSSDVSVTGRLGKFGLGIMKKKAHALGEQFAENFRQRIAPAAAE